jgi:hypothetical protein
LTGLGVGYITLTDIKAALKKLGVDISDVGMP